jgi:hypothetical protein
MPDVTDTFHIPPALVLAYEEAVAEVYDVDKYVPKRDWARVYAVEQGLVRKGVDINHFARTVARLWKQWCDDKDMKAVPLNAAIGEKSVNWYLQYQTFGVDVLPPDRAKAVILHDEVTLALLFIRSRLSGSNVSMRYLRGTIRLSPDWHQAYEDNLLPTLEAATQVCAILRVECTSSSYYDIIEVLSERKLHMEQGIS